jgi:hypothetical protein
MKRGRRIDGTGFLHQRHSQAGRGLLFHTRDDEIAVIVAIRTMRTTTIAEIFRMGFNYYREHVIVSIGRSLQGCGMGMRSFLQLPPSDDYLYVDEQYPEAFSA